MGCIKNNYLYAQNIGIQLYPQRVLTDFELALQQSVAICFTQAERKGCLFHYAQAVWRKVQSLGLQRLYKEDDDFRAFVNCVIALAFVPPTFVRVAWRGLKTDAPSFANQSAFFEYFETTWLNGMFPVRMWNVYVCCYSCLKKKVLDEMGHLHLLLDEMGLDEMGLDEMG